MIFDYSKYLSSVGHMGIVNYKTVDSNTQFFSHESICPFCKQVITNVAYQITDTSHDDWLWGSFSQSEEVIQCPTCGWWEYTYSNQSDAILEGIRASDIIRHTAILEKYYEDSDDNVPISLLRSYIEKHPDKITAICRCKFSVDGGSTYFKNPQGYVKL